SQTTRGGGRAATTASSDAAGISPHSRASASTTLRPRVKPTTSIDARRSRRAMLPPMRPSPMSPKRTLASRLRGSGLEARSVPASGGSAQPERRLELRDAPPAGRGRDGRRGEREEQREREVPRADPADRLAPADAVGEEPVQDALHDEVRDARDEPREHGRE